MQSLINHECSSMYVLYVPQIGRGNCSVQSLSDIRRRTQSRSKARSSRCKHGKEYHSYRTRSPSGRSSYSHSQPRTRTQRTTSVDAMRAHTPGLAAAVNSPAARGYRGPPSLSPVPCPAGWLIHEKFPNRSCHSIISLAGPKTFMLPFVLRFRHWNMTCIAV